MGCCCIPGMGLFPWTAIWRWSGRGWPRASILYAMIWALSCCSWFWLNGVGPAGHPGPPGPPAPPGATPGPRPGAPAPRLGPGPGPGPALPGGPALLLGAMLCGSGAPGQSKVVRPEPGPPEDDEEAEDGIRGPDGGPLEGLEWPEPPSGEW